MVRLWVLLALVALLSVLRLVLLWLAVLVLLPIQRLVLLWLAALLLLPVPLWLAVRALRR